MIRQCHRCELRFATEAELNEHLSRDHSVDASVFEPYRYPADRDSLPPLYAAAPEGAERRRYLVVANQTLGGDALTERVRSLVAAQPSFFHVLVPATHSADYPVTSETFASAGAGRALPGPTDEKGVAQARWRLRRALELFRSLGAEVSGEVGPPDPLEAVAALLEREQFDEAIVSTLPSGVSRWLGIDLPQRIERRWDLPVSTVVVSQPQVGSAPAT
jgi:hypothetical protein